jgi:hypothetical protein
LGIKIENYIEAMKVKFDCIESQGKIFYSTKQECEQAIKFIDFIKIMNELSR